MGRTTRGGRSYSQSTLLKRTALVAGALIRRCTNGRAVSPITCDQLVGWRWTRKPSGLGGRRLLLSSGTTLLVGAPGRCSGRRAQLKPPFPVPIGRGRSYTAPGAPGLETLPCEKKVTHVGRIWIGMSRSTRGAGSASPVKFACGVLGHRQCSFCLAINLFSSLSLCGVVRAYPRKKNEKKGVETLAHIALPPLAAPGPGPQHFPPRAPPAFARRGSWNTPTNVERRQRTQG